jgi:hypothetical protein
LLAELRARKRGSTVEGVVRTKQQPYDYNHELSGVDVELHGKNITYSAVMSGSVYRFTGIPAGAYQLIAKLPPDFPKLANDASGNPPSITITKQSCYAKDLYALPARPPSP